VAADTPDARLAREHDAPTLAAALVARLRADGRPELAAALVSMLSLNPNPPSPHREGDDPA
jgi:hypothetical protein